MKHKTVVYLGLAALCLIPTVPANADPVRTAQVQLPPFEILTIVRSTGLDPLGQPLRRGSAYVLRAVDGYGEEVRVTVDARRGEILSVQPVVPVAAPYEVPNRRYGDPRFVDPRYRFEPYDDEPDMRYETLPPDPRGPRVIYAPRATAKPPVSKATPSAKGPSKNAPKSAAVTPAEPASDPATTNSTTPAAPKTIGAPAPAVPPVQGFE
jgi:cell division septation protein DedD